MLRIVLDGEQQQNSWVRKSICVAVCGQTGNVASGTIGPFFELLYALTNGFAGFQGNKFNSCNVKLERLPVQR